MPSLYNIYVAFIVPGSILIPTAIAAFNYKFLDKPLKIILLFLIGSALINLVALIMAHHGIPNLVIFHLYSIFEFGLISWFYMQLFKSSWGKIITILIIIFTISSLINLIFVQKSMQFNTYTRSVEAVIIIGYCVLFFNQQSTINLTQDWGSISFNWIKTGILIYYSCCFFEFLSSNYLRYPDVSREFIHVVWYIIDTILMIEYILFAIGFYKCRKQPIISSY
jgi:hypothetical protein